MRAWYIKHRQEWLEERGMAHHEFPPVVFPDSKPGAFVSLDDRAITFEGEWPDVDWLRAFKPWNKRGE
jgi:hypothetical protein